MSSSEIAVSVRGVSKAYKIAHKSRQLHATLAETVLHRLRHPFNSGSEETFWALDDVSFDLGKGEVVGVIGRNGAGKSTLLKILSRITEPTKGEIRLWGRVGSLLEVGTGFHPELTGRENIFLNGAILGMARPEIRRQFDAIVEFAEVEQFLDTPVKRYSSGMYVRLAFAVAAHLQPEILIVDEVLAVGDAKFQQKCLGKMQDVAQQQGRTVLFVSHNMAAVKELCTSCLLLRQGRVVSQGPPSEAVANYLSDQTVSTLNVVIPSDENPGSQALLTRVWISTPSGGAVRSIGVNDGFRINMRLLVRERLDQVEVSARIYNSLRQPLFTTNLSDESEELGQFEAGVHDLSVPVPAPFLAPGHYILGVGVHQPNARVFDNRDEILRFTVEETGSKMWQYSEKGYGNLIVHFPWRCRPASFAREATPLLQKQDRS